MKVNKINNNLSVSRANNPSMTAGLYFAKPGVLFNPNVSFVDTEGQKITQKGVRYFENNELAENIRKRISEIPFVKELSKKYETFVTVIQSKPKDTTNIQKIEIQYADYEKNKVKKYEAYGFLTKPFRHFLDAVHSNSLPGRKIPENLEYPIDIAIAKIQNGIYD